MNFKPFYIRYDESMSDQDVADVLDKAVSKGADLYESVGVGRGVNPLPFRFFGVDKDYDTYFSDTTSFYGDEAVELTLDQVDAHLDISNIKEVPTLIPHIHAKEIKAWADGYEIEVFLTSTFVGAGWYNSNNPDWDPQAMYRIKITEEELDLSDELKELEDRRKKVLNKLKEYGKIRRVVY